ncbi:hypothetical protein C5E45_34020 [Nocardia nova]|uniref:Uncharacterized protein n=1 Tax=Nocardia nova TaxID=37330 RepID=A0A2S6A8R3_9NOCA|nr:hypothetical protein C5E45_34020 [Nocardia nova]
MVRGREWTGFEAAALQEAMRCSVRDFAHMLGVETTTIANWRSGLSAVTPRPRTQAILDTAYQQRATPEDRQRFTQIVAEGEAAWRNRHRQDRRSAPVPSVRTAYDEATWSPALQADDVRRSEFLRGLLAVSATVLTDDVIAAAVKPIDPPTTRVGWEHVERVRDWASVFRSADDAGLHVGDAMVAQLRVAADYLGAEMSAPVRIGMQAAVGTFFRVVGWAHYDRGNHETARANFQAGLHCAEQAEEWWLRATVLTCLARQAIYLGHLDDALTMLGLASIRSDRLSLLRRADIAAVQARAFGKLGNAAECRRAVDQAEQLFVESDGENHPDTEHEGFKTYYNRSLLQGDTAQGLFDLAYHRKAEVSTTIERLQSALNLSDEYARSRQLSLLRLAALQIRHGDPEDGLMLGTQAVERGAASSSRRVRDGLVLVHQATGDPRVERSPAARELRSAITDLLVRPVDTKEQL